VLGGTLIDGSIGTLVVWATMPASMLVSLRMVFAALTLGVVVAVRRDWRALVADKATSARLLICGVALALNLLAYFIAIRQTGVAVAIFLSYLAPVYVAVVAPHLGGGRTEGVVWGALGVALGGMALILVPGLSGDGARLTAYGLFFAVLAGVMYAVYLIVGQQLRRRGAHATTIVFAMCALAAVLMLPLGIAQSSVADLTSRNLLIAAVLGIVCTALTFSLIMDGLRFIKVQHAAIMGYIEPVTAPLYALAFLGQVPSRWTVAGGALIIAAGVLVVIYGSVEPEPEFHE
jgi:drug/metabolite transporter (DMT)-like permease